jgi:hypothetical protein
MFLIEEAECSFEADMVMALVMVLSEGTRYVVSRTHDAALCMVLMGRLQRRIDQGPARSSRE